MKIHLRMPRWQTMTKMLVLFTITLLMVLSKCKWPIFMRYIKQSTINNIFFTKCVPSRVRIHVKILGTVLIGPIKAIQRTRKYLRVLHSDPWNPWSQPFMQLPFTWWQMSRWTQCPHSLRQFSPYVILSQSESRQH